MTNKQALREAAENVIQKYGSEWFETGHQVCTVHGSKIMLIAAANPVTVLALLDELEAKDKLIAELEASHGNLREAMAGIHNTITGGGAYTPLAAILNASKLAYEESAIAAGRINGEG